MAASSRATRPKDSWPWNLPPPGWNRGIPLSEERKAHLSAVTKGKTFSAATKAKISAANRGRKHSAEIRAKNAAAQRRRHHGDMTIDEYFDAHVEELPGRDACWLWTGPLVYCEYGGFRWDGTRQKAHRFAYERANGPIPPGHTVHHKCRTKLCERPSHLVALSKKEHAKLHAKEDR